MSQQYDIIFTNAVVATVDKADTVHSPGAIAVRDSRIAWTGPADALPGNSREMVDVGGRLITPGLVDCHTHLVFGGSRSGEFQQRLAGATYADIARGGGGILSTVSATRSASEDELYDSARLRLLQLIQDGVTTVEIKSGYGLEVETEAKMLRVARRLGETLPVSVRTTFLGAHTLPPEFASDRSGYLDLVCNDMLPALARDRLVDAVDAFCEGIAFTPDETARVFDAAARLQLPLKLHADQLSDSGGAALAARYSALSADHLEYLSEAGVVAMAAAGTVAVLLPGAFFMLKETRRPPVALFRQHGVPMALATDCNPGSSPVLSLRLMAAMGCQLFGLTVSEALRAITASGAAALGLADDRGTLAKGMCADFVVWNASQPADLVYWLGGDLVHQSVCGGQANTPRQNQRAWR